MIDIEGALKILGLSPGATSQDIKQAYRDLVKVWHPDRFLNDARLCKKAENNLKKINNAYDSLKDYIQPSTTKSNSDFKSDSRTHHASSGRPHDFREQDTRQSKGTSPPPPPPYESHKSRPFSSPTSINKNKFKVLLMSFGAAGLLIVASIYISKSNSFVKNRSEIIAEEYSEIDMTKLPTLPTPEEYERMQAEKKKINSSSQNQPRSNASKLPTLPTPEEYERRQAEKRQINSSSQNQPRSNASKLPTLSDFGEFERMRAEKKQTNFFGVGSTKDEVLSIQGEPTRITAWQWGYGLSTVTFEDGRVISWYNSPQNPLKVKIPK